MTSRMNRRQTDPHDEWVQEWVVTEEESGERIDKFAAECAEEGVSRTQVQDWIRSGHVTVNGAAVKPNYRLAEGDVVAMMPPEPEDADVQPEPIPLHIVYEDRDVIVVDKPRGMVVHPAHGHLSGTLVNALLHHCRDLSGINGRLRPGIVHRIDKDTTGLLAAAKNDLAHVSLSEQLKAHTVERAYIALVHGNLPHDQGTIDAPIGRDPRDRKRFAVVPGGKPSVTHFAVLERFGDYTLVRLNLETGRTHQIRVHMKYIGYPLAGDPIYGRAKTVPLDGQALHAAALGFVHPRSREKLRFESPLPDDLRAVLEMLRNR